VSGERRNTRFGEAAGPKFMGDRSYGGTVAAASIEQRRQLLLQSLEASNPALSDALRSGAGAGASGSAIRNRDHEIDQYRVYEQYDAPVLKPRAPKPEIASHLTNEERERLEKRRTRTHSRSHSRERDKKDKHKSGSSKPADSAASKEAEERTRLRDKLLSKASPSTSPPPAGAALSKSLMKGLIKKLGESDKKEKVGFVCAKNRVSVC
jgi:hypothetical protein